MRQKHQAPRAQPQPQNHMPPKPLPVVGRPEEKDKKEGKAVTVTESFLWGMRLLGAGHWEGPGVGRGDHTKRLLPGLGMGFLSPVPTTALLGSLCLVLFWMRTLLL